MSMAQQPGQVRHRKHAFNIANLVHTRPDDPERLESTIFKTASQNKTSHSGRFSICFAICFTLLLFSWATWLIVAITACQRRLVGFYEDEVGMADFAAPYNNASVVQELTTQTSSSSSNLTAQPNLPNRLEPQHILGAHRLVPGICWLLEEPSGQLAIQFLKPIRVSHITVDHISKSLVSPISMSSAPREIKVWGFIRNTLPHISLLPSSLESPKIGHAGLIFHLLGTVKYDISAAGSFQTFDLGFGRMYEVEGVVVEIITNWGSNSTCLYRIRVHSATDDAYKLGKFLEL